MLQRCKRLGNGVGVGRYITVRDCFVTSRFFGNLVHAVRIRNPHEFVLVSTKGDMVSGT
jgi:hypothetical protein